MRRFVMKKIYSLLIAMTFVLLAACNGSTTSDGELKEIVLAGGDWDSLNFHNSVAQIIIEEGYGYDTDVKMGSTAATFQGLRQGDINVYMEVWTHTLKDIYAEGLEAGDVQKVSVNFGDNAGGFHVPTYVIEGDSERGIEPVAPDLKTVEDLKQYPELFPDREDANKGIIYNGPSEWEISQLISDKFDAYELEEQYNLMSAGSQAALNASLESAYAAGEPWVGYTWSPTAITAKLDLTLLEEPAYDEEVFKETRMTQLPPEEVDIAVHKDFPDQAPEITEFLSNYETSSELTEIGIQYIYDNETTTEEAAKWWLTENEDVWTEWVPEEVAEKVKQSLS